MVEERDVVIVGGGIAGLVSAHRLRDLDPVVLEASERVGGRIWSKQRGELALSVGAHMFPPPDSVIGRLVTELGLELKPITGSMLNIHLGGRIVRDTRPELLPFELPLSLGGRVSFARAGLKVKRDADAYMRLLQRRPGDTDAAVRLRDSSTGATRRFSSSSAGCVRTRSASSRRLRTALSPIPTRSRSPRWRRFLDTSGTAGIWAATAQWLRAAAGRARRRAGLDRARRLPGRVAAPGRGGRARRVRGTRRSRRDSRAHGDRRRAGAGPPGHSRRLHDCRPPDCAQRRDLRSDGGAEHPHRRDGVDAVG